MHPRQFAVLRFLAEGSGSGASQRAISAALGIPPSRLVGLLDELERQGLAVRDPGRPGLRQPPSAGRRTPVRLTPTGEELAASLGEVKNIAGTDRPGAAAPTPARPRPRPLQTPVAALPSPLPQGNRALGQLKHQKTAIPACP
ncbi:MAG: winged helix-turn-helix transcriptional regulator [Micropruina sp.]|nr:MAG: winged helix-turn-helix transcriptional regulator [Micropruina sp.]